MRLIMPILATLAEEVQKMLENIRVLAAASLASSFKSRQERLEQKEAEEVKAFLQRPAAS